MGLFGDEKSQASGLCAKGYNLLQRGKEEAAAEMFEKAILSDRSNTEGWTGLGRAFSLLKRYRQAIECFERTLEISPYNTDALIGKGIVLRLLCIAQKDPLHCLEAIEIFNSILVRDEENEEAMHEKGMALWTIGKKEEAIGIFDRILRFHSQYEYPWELKGQFLYLTHAYQDAVTCYEKALVRDSKNPVLLAEEGRCLSHMGAIDHAITLYTRSLKYDSHDPAVWVLLATAYTSLKQFDDAIACYNNAMELDEENTAYKKAISEVLFKKANQILYKEGRYDEALLILEHILDINPVYADAWYSRGIAYKKKGSYTNALACLLRVAELKPALPHAYFEMGNILERQNLKEDALSCYMDAIRCDPGHIDALYRIGILYLESGHFMQALRYMERVLERRSDLSTAWYAKGKAYLGHGQEKEAKQCFEQARKLVGE